jgi:hypothetical protein
MVTAANDQVLIYSWWGTGMKYDTKEAVAQYMAPQYVLHGQVCLCRTS